MKRISLLAIVLCGLASACTVRSERTVVEHPAPAAVVAEPAPAAVVVPAN